MNPIIAVFDHALKPVAPFTWFGLPITTLDIVAAFRLCLILRQTKEVLHREHVSKVGHSLVENRSFARSALTTLTVVFGGEAMTSPLIGVPCSFMVSGATTIFYTLVQAIVDALPLVPAPTFEMELPLSIVDGFTRAFLLCDLIPPVVTANASSNIANSSWTLLVTSFVAANGGFFLTNLFSLMNPTPMMLQTPPELMPYGWTTSDLWCAPAITGLYALLTHAQPFWAEAHTFIFDLLNGGAVSEKAVHPVDNDTARAVCAVLLAALFAGRTVKNFRHLWLEPKLKVKTQ
ncbi:uncharacterized protein BT62DRAFT_925574 [Guyanagaster necrorhizus]|uniref:Uncharacterized protein n=1 Tax=Guyanagaster necrorhizus TaxID=856835 RepID=A0A9P7W428_9AGAR|nr:uncharacterized protein BT62DRAFT_925574 [Guyanagaster necrorhizus MCA 3950]KAG7453031.1 hypothetical protein BT62DRAFT_925574 [Guyanagaster necrorhizus MCA 3950]